MDLEEIGLRERLTFQLLSHLHDASGPHMGDSFSDTLVTGLIATLPIASLH